MKRITNQPLGIAQGSHVLFSDFTNGGPMWTGSGSREARHRVRFDTAFVSAPSVMVGFSMWDLDRETNARADICAEKITPKGFEIVFRTWGDTRIARIRADWMAIGPLQDNEMWDLY